MASCTSYKMMSAAERNKMLSGPRTVLLVGPNRKYYGLPTQLICRMSPHLARLVAESKGQKLELLKENVEEFNVLVEFMLRGVIPGANAKRSIEGNKSTIDQCLRFLESAYKYQIGDVSDVVFEPLLKAFLDLTNHKYRNDSNDMKRIAKSGIRCGIEANDIETIFELCPPGNRLRTLATQAALSYSGPEGVNIWDEQMENVSGFATELMDQVVAGFSRHSWVEPLTKIARRWVEPLAKITRRH
ncbi:uncharacterized protein LY89DRAFT_785306 [Mollisia scopiformis]|uniref:BTB/POZ domain-containing protein n=1 Tax=Mollisia scopiformis TaxID=149040 RepID=A0A194WXK4_MOLSC|nr:uncharacterized protein LY89DRAFT_785306 [Mollisia scopiformis]KUJ12713.1 hypothetical protein LY89DRAFT_785306 [Mollisia scopiformis]